jgi:hypothetical protein
MPEQDTVLMAGAIPQNLTRLSSVGFYVAAAI